VTEEKPVRTFSFPKQAQSVNTSPLLGHFLWKTSWDEFIIIPKGIIGGYNLRRRFSSNPTKLLGVQHRDRIEAHGTQRRDTAGGKRDEGKHHGDGHEGKQIVWRYTEEQSGH